MDFFTVLNSSIKRLSHVRRYASFRAIWEENVAEHVYFAMKYGHVLACDLQRRGYEVNVQDVLEHLLYHDDEEALTGDQINIFKNSTPQLKRAIKEASALCMKQLASEFGTHGERILSILDRPAGKTLEDRIVDFADLVCIIAYIREDIQSGNQAFEPVMRDIHRILTTMWQDEVFGPYVYSIYPDAEHPGVDLGEFTGARAILRPVFITHNTDSFPCVDEDGNPRDKGVALGKPVEVPA